MATMFTHSNSDVMHTYDTVLRCYAEQHVSMETWLYIRVWSSLKILHTLKLTCLFNNNTPFFKCLISATFSPLLDHNDQLLKNAPDHNLKRSDTTYHCAFLYIFYYWRWIPYITVLYSAIKCQSLYIFWLIFVHRCVKISMVFKLTIFHVCPQSQKRAKQ